MNPLVIKLCAAAALSICGMLIGRMLSQAHARRAAVLMDFEYSLNLLENRMLFERMPLAAALKASDASLFKQIGEYMEKSDVGAPAAWAAIEGEAFYRGGSLDGLTKEDKPAVTDFFLSLGASGLNDQKLLFSKTREMIKPLREASLGKYKEVSKLYSTLGALLGLAISILLL